MAALDMDRLPTGQHHWRALIDELLAVGDDRYEGHHLELKSEVDTSTKPGRAKIAKFILAAANRAPDFAANRFGGYAVMLVGLDYSTTPPSIGGSAAFDDKDLRREVTEFVGDPGPRWDYQRIDVDGKEVVVIIVDPPEEAAIWPCQRDGEGGMRTGVLYLRAGAETRPATGPQVTAMIARVRHAQPDVAIDVEILGSVWAVASDPTAAIAHVRQAAGELRATCPSPPASTTTSGIGFAPGSLSSVAMSGFASRNDSRSRPQFHAEVDDYETVAIAAVDDVHDAVVAAAQGFSVKVTNKTTRSLDDVEVVIHLAPPFDLVDHDDDIATDLLPSPPRKWGPEPFSIPGMRQQYYPPPALPEIGGWMRVEERADGGLDVMVDVGHLRPKKSVTTDDDELVLIAPGDAAETLMQASWSMTARDVHDEFTGEIRPVPVTVIDVSETVAAHVALEIRSSRDS